MKTAQGASRRSLPLAPQHEVLTPPHPEEARERRLEGCATGPNDVFSSPLAASRFRQGEDGAGRGDAAQGVLAQRQRSEEHTSELQSLMRISYAVFCMKKK